MFRKLVLIIAFVIFICQPAYADEDKALSGASTLGEVFGYITNYHLNQPDVDQLTKAGIKGILDQLGDPYTVYFSPGELEQFSEELDGDFEGIGAELELKNQYPQVVRVLTGSPADQAGLKNGDIIIAVDGKAIAGKQLYEIVDMLRGQKDTTVEITIQRTGVPASNIKITRSTVNMPTVLDKNLGNGIGYIAVDSFGMETGQEFANALIKLKEENINSLIIDLRYNGGGFVDSAAEITSYLLGKDKTVFVTEDRDKHKDSYITEADPLIEKMPIVVLVNDQTASASEILAGALQDYGFATILGTKTYGKGTVQDIVPLQNGGALKLTTAIYLTPKGQKLNGIGLQPDRYVQMPELQLFAAQQLLQPVEPEIKFSDSGIAVNGEAINNTTLGVIKEGKEVFVPLRFILEALGYEIKWDDSTNCIIAKGQADTLVLPANGIDASHNGQPVKLKEPLKYKNVSSYISIRDLSLLGIDVQTKGADIIIKRN